jgi:phosphoglycolate phosphatase-like HAD superfamily hydrolase
MTVKKKTLAVFDLDNTLTDTLTFWATALRPVAHTLSTSFGMSEERIADRMLAAPSQFRFNDVGRLVDWLDEQGELPRAHNPHEQHQIDMTKWVLRQNWYATQKRMTTFYPGALDTLNRLKDGGTSTVLYTDAEASSMIRRVWFLAHNARRTGAIEHEEDVIELFNHFYSQPSYEDDQRVLRDIDVRFTLKMKEKMSIWTTARYKPQPDLMKIIMKDFGARARDTVMVGDTHNDGGGAVPHRASFAWAHYGARIAPEIEDAARKMASTHYKYGVKDISACFDASCRADVTLQESPVEIFNHFRFAAGNPFSPHDAAAANTPRRNRGGQAAQNPAVHRLHDPLRLHTRTTPLGPASHFEPKP